MSSPADFPRHRRLRSQKRLRELVQETTLSRKNLIQPVFVHAGLQEKREIPSMPDIFQYPLSECVEKCKRIEKAGIPAVILFGIPESKDQQASKAYADDGIVQKALRAIKQETEELTVIADICLCEYMSHGHCGVVNPDTNRIQNDPSLALLQKTALATVEAGADMVAPSAMMDGQIQAIRTALDEANYEHCPILSYAAKYASNYYGPFRDAAESPPQFGDRKTYQMDTRNGKEALREIRADLQQGADIVMVKPALSYLDIIQKASDWVEAPVFAYSVSGEYAMVKAAAQKGWIDEKQVAMESLISMRRAGASAILTYWAEEVANWLEE